MIVLQDVIAIRLITMASVQAPAERGIEKCGYLKIKRPPISGKVRIKVCRATIYISGIDSYQNVKTCKGVDM